MPHPREVLRDATLWTLRATGMYSSWALRRSGALAEDGWFRSFRDHRSTDGAGNPTPWMTYPAIHFLAGRVTAEMAVFEYGSGNSTLWWATRAGSVLAVEHDPTYLDELRTRLPPNARVDLVIDRDEYVTTPLRSGQRYDVIVIDGERRDDCAEPAVGALSDGGVIVLDDTEGHPLGRGKAAPPRRRLPADRLRRASTDAHLAVRDIGVLPGVELLRDLNRPARP